MDRCVTVTSYSNKKTTMIDPKDTNTNPLPLEDNGEATPGVPSITQARAEARLQNEFDLVRLHGPVYVQNKRAAAARSAGAERVAKHRQKLAAEGMRPTAVPAALLNEVKIAGSWAEWQAKKDAAAAPPPPQIIEKIVEKLLEVPGPERIVEKRVEVRVEVPGPEHIVEIEKQVEIQISIPAKLGARDTESLSLGRKVQALKSWRAAVLRWLL